jgi:hypothetical protein
MESDLAFFALRKSVKSKYMGCLDNLLKLTLIEIKRLFKGSLMR